MKSAAITLHLADEFNEDNGTKAERFGIDEFYYCLLFVSNTKVDINVERRSRFMQW